jgi:hypothetical protein
MIESLALIPENRALLLQRSSTGKTSMSRRLLRVERGLPAAKSNLESVSRRKVPVREIRKSRRRYRYP